MMREKVNKHSRTLDIYMRLCNGKIINKTEEALNYGVDERSIARDIADIRAVLHDVSAEYAVMCERSVVFDRINNGYKMVGNEASVMSNGEILAVSKILLESRAFAKKEIVDILDKLIAGCASQESKKMVEDAVRNERYHYIELHNKSYVKDKLWELNEEVQHCNLLEIVYEKAVASKEVVTRIVEPAAVLFSEYYFYLNAYIMEQNEQGKYVRQYEYPTVFRIDRIAKYKEIGQKSKATYANRFEEGEFRKRVQFMQAGKLHKCRFRYTGRNNEAVFDRLPTAMLVSEDENGCVFEVETYGRGVMMWLLSQGANVEVLWPESFRERMKKELSEMLSKYGSDM